MSNAGGAWDNSKKLCEKLKIKKSDQGKACIVGDTVGDPFKDTSGPALNILIKLMSMIALTVAPLVKERQSWDLYYFGFIPLGVCILVAAVLVYANILTWKDPLAKAANRDTKPLVGTKDACEEVIISMEKEPSKEEVPHVA